MKMNQFIKLALRLIFSLGLVASVGGLRAQETQTLKAISVSSHSGAEVVRFDFSEAVTFRLNGFGIQSPARVALDLPVVGSALQKNVVEFTQGNIKSVNVIQASDRTRMVLNLKRYQAYSTQVVGKSVLVTFEPAASSTPSGTTVS